MNSPFQIIGIAWNFYRKQPVLSEIAFWLMFLPVASLDALGSVVETASAQGYNITLNEFSALTPMQIALAIPIAAVIIYLVLWGQACTLMVAKRLVSSPAGRTRTSFKAVRKQAKKYIGALFLTEILRTIITLLLGLLLIVPGVIYSIRTTFYSIMMIEGGKVRYGRDALKPSYDLVKGHTWDIFWRLAVMGLCIFLPVGLVESIMTESLLLLDARLDTLGLVLNDLIDAFAGVFFLVCTVALYADLKENIFSNSNS